MRPAAAGVAAPYRCTKNPCVSPRLTAAEAFPPDAPAELCHGARAPARFERVGARSIALQRAREYPLKNRRQPKQVERKIVRPDARRHRLAAPARAIIRDEFGFARNLEPRQIESAECAESIRGHAPAHGEIRELHERCTQG